MPQFYSTDQFTMFLFLFFLTIDPDAMLAPEVVPVSEVIFV